eukprot:755079-Hanusia_phi.AAC.1
MHTKNTARAMGPNGEGKERKGGSNGTRFSESQKIMRMIKQLSAQDRVQYFKAVSSQGKADLFHYTEMISRSASVREAEEFMSSMQQRGIAPSTTTYALMLKKYQQEGKTAEVWKMLQEIEAKNGLRDNHVRSIVLYGLCRVHCNNEAERYWNAFKREHPKPDFVLYNTAVYMYVLMNKFPEARMTIKEMREAGFQPTAHTYTPIIDRCGTLRMFNEVNEILEEMDRERSDHSGHAGQACTQRHHPNSVEEGEDGPHLQTHLQHAGRQCRLTIRAKAELEAGRLGDRRKRIGERRKKQEGKHEAGRAGVCVRGGDGG